MDEGDLDAYLFLLEFDEDRCDLGVNLTPVHRQERQMRNCRVYALSMFLHPPEFADLRLAFFLLFLLSFGRHFLLDQSCPDVTRLDQIRPRD